MKPKKMLKNMCDYGLTTADRKAICKARGFPASYVSSPDLLHHVFLSDTGVKKAVAQLDEKECILLHLILFMKREVDITFFSRIYPAMGANSWGITFNRKYKIVFDNVRKNLIRRGILIFDQTLERILDEKTILERQRFCFPPEFSRHLPPPIAVKEIDNPKIILPPESILRKKLAEIFSAEPEVRVESETEAESGNIKGRLHIKDGVLLMNNTEFTEQQLQSWNTSLWINNMRIPKQSDSLPLGRLLDFFLSRMDVNQWFHPLSLIPLFETVFPDDDLPDPVSDFMETFCEKGWRRGCLAKTAAGKTFYYRSAKNDTLNPALKPGDYLTAMDENTFAVDLNLVGYKSLEIIARAFRMQVTGGRLTGKIDFIRLSRCMGEIEQEPDFLWLHKHHSGIKDTAALIKKRRNKTIIHENVMTAKISDLTLKIMIEKKFAATGKLISLNDEFIVFPPALLPEIQKLTKKAGHVIKKANSVKGY